MPVTYLSPKQVMKHLAMRRVALEIEERLRDAHKIIDFDVRQNTIAQLNAKMSPKVRELVALRHYGLCTISHKCFSVLNYDLTIPMWKYKLDQVEKINDKAIICKQELNKNGKPYYCYANYDRWDIPDLALLTTNVYELLPGDDGAVKPYFDCELERESGITQRDERKYSLGMACLRIFLENKFKSMGYEYSTETNLIETSSNSDKKLSNHFVVHGYFFTVKNAKDLYNEVIAFIDSITNKVLYYKSDSGHLKCIIDGSVYNRRPFRLPYCSKLNSERYLLPVKGTYHPMPRDGDEILNLIEDNDVKEILRKKWYVYYSMISFTADCKALDNGFVTEHKKTYPVLGNFSLTEEQYNAIINIYERYPILNKNYEIVESNNLSIVYLKRREGRTVKCPNISHGDHKSNNSYLYWDIIKNCVVFKCYAHDGVVVFC